MLGSAVHSSFGGVRAGNAQPGGRDGERGEREERENARETAQLNRTHDGGQNG